MGKISSDRPAGILALLTPDFRALYNTAHYIVAIPAVANLWHACPKWHVRRFQVARQVYEIYPEIVAESYFF